MINLCNNYLKMTNILTITIKKNNKKKYIKKICIKKNKKKIETQKKIFLKRK